MSSIWNFANPLTSGSLKLAKAGRELYGTVVRSGINNKTVTVKVNRFFYDQHYKKTYSRTGLFHVHDEAEFCKIGDKVVIQSCRPMSKTKRYFVRNVVVMTGRPFELGAINADKKVEVYNENKWLRIEEMAKEKAEQDANTARIVNPLWAHLVKDMKLEDEGKSIDDREEVKMPEKIKIKELGKKDKKKLNVNRGVNDGKLEGQGKNFDLSGQADNTENSIIKQKGKKDYKKPHIKDRVKDMKLDNEGQIIAKNEEGKQTEQMIINNQGEEESIKDKKDWKKKQGSNEFKPRNSSKERKETKEKKTWKLGEESKPKEIKVEKKPLESKEPETSQDIHGNKD